MGNLRSAIAGMLILVVGAMAGVNAGLTTDNSGNSDEAVPIELVELVELPLHVAAESLLIYPVSCEGVSNGSSTVSDTLPNGVSASMPVTCDDGDAFCEEGLRDLGWHFPEGTDGFYSGEEGNAIMQTMHVCQTTDANGQGDYTTTVAYEGFQTGGDEGPCNDAGNRCRLGPTHYTETAFWTVSSGGVIVDHTPSSSWEYGPETTYSYSLGYSGGGASGSVEWEKSYSEFYQDRTVPPTGGEVGWGSGTNVKRDDTETSYGISVIAPHPGFCMDYHQETKFHHERTAWPDHHHTYGTVGQWCVVNGSLIDTDAPVECKALAAVWIFLMPGYTGGCLPITDLGIFETDGKLFDSKWDVVDAISSILIPEGCSVTLYDGPTGTGGSMTLTSSSAILRDLSTSGFDNAVKSIMVEDDGGSTCDTNSSWE